MEALGLLLTWAIVLLIAVRLDGAQRRRQLRAAFERLQRDRVFCRRQAD